jgi:uncharacterized protein (TIGR00296 family)
MKLTLAQAKKLIKLARDTISAYFKGNEPVISESIKKEFSEKQGAFVSVYLKKELNGCIGITTQNLPLYKAIMYCAKAAAFEDPRFPPLLPKQFKDIIIEISILTPIEPIELKKDPSEYFKLIKIGRDGLMVKDEFGSGLLLPQVAVEWKWDVKEFLNQTCIKAGLDPDCWNNMRRNVYKFQAQVFAEKGKSVIEKKLKVS